jgi:hypothetical protein
MTSMFVDQWMVPMTILGAHVWVIIYIAVGWWRQWMAPLPTPAPIEVEP